MTPPCRPRSSSNLGCRYQTRSRPRGYSSASSEHSCATGPTRWCWPRRSPRLSWGADRACRVGAAITRLDDARGGQPGGDGPRLGSSAVHILGRARELGGGGNRRPGSRPRRRRDDRRMVGEAGAASPLASLGLEPRGICARDTPSSLADGPPGRFAGVLGMLRELAAELPVVFQTHPRTRARLSSADHRVGRRVALLEPLRYLDFLALERWARLVIIHSGGVQEETSALGVPCLTYCTTTERPVTIELGANRLIGTEPAARAWPAGARHWARLRSGLDLPVGWERRPGRRSSDREAAGRLRGGMDLHPGSGGPRKRSRGPLSDHERAAR